MILKVRPSQLSGSVKAPSSKSLSQRFIAAALLANEPSRLFNYSECDDCTAAMKIALDLGAEIELAQSGIGVTPSGGGIPQPRTNELSAGESGLSFRLFSAIAALSSEELTLNAEGTLLNRPQQFVADGLNALGAKASLSEGKAPLSITDHLKGGEFELDGSTSSQFLTGLLLALPYAEKDSVLKVQGLVSRPYIEMTLEVMEMFELDCKHTESEDVDIFEIPGNQSAKGGDYLVDGDWSAAAALLTIGSLTGAPEIEVTGIRGPFTQADSAIKGALLFAGYHLLGTDDGLQVKKKKPHAFNLDLTNSPDLFPVLAVLAGFSKKKSTLKGVNRLRGKECDRASVLQSELGKAGITIEIEGDTMSIIPGTIKSCKINSHGDHRIVMAAAIIGCAGAEIEIEGAECVSKSYPEFFDDLESLGANISTANE
jgi:3-phosphoshikimate 1-carboxyvinyltransferase